MINVCMIVLLCLLQVRTRLWDVLSRLRQRQDGGGICMQGQCDKIEARHTTSAEGIRSERREHLDIFTLHAHIQTWLDGAVSQVLMVPVLVVTLIADKHAAVSHHRCVSVFLLHTIPPLHFDSLSYCLVHLLTLRFFLFLPTFLLLLSSAPLCFIPFSQLWSLLFPAQPSSSLTHL